METMRKTRNKAGAKATKTRRSHPDLIDGVVGGERVLIVRARPEREKAIETRIRVALAVRGVLVWKHHVNNRAGARTGLGLGTADLICVVPPHGRFLGIEVKRPRTGRVSEVQKRWLGIVQRAGGIAGVATSVEEAIALVELARRAS